ncbi:nucleoside triphosphate hydrolase [Thalassospira marina]|uniref:Nucleoside/nucleotide kinase family protein n=1 Tax=Thalassospira marina TaxID=2048283 RepID=A0A2N3KXC0_9PROT|nr:nucleoside triphosphate hydrolase [Thalassospira marina]AUG54000.1 nucleoside/nucleotide kinase family protein [Thalassospira marina]PKR55133.1 nucleoside/nucleotide kinase family protein [Thalassospira marina]
MTIDLDQIASLIAARRSGEGRMMVAIAGAPASGKSTLSERLHHHLGGDEAGVAVVPMDGFHFDDAILRERGDLARKGAPHTFDVGGFARYLAAIREDDEDIFVPVFDRKLELSRGSARCIGKHHRLILVEGNYLLLKQAPWNRLASLFDLKLMLDVPMGVLEQRLIQRWLDHGFDQKSATSRALENDIPNARVVQSQSGGADHILQLTPEYPA